MSHYQCCLQWEFASDRINTNYREEIYLLCMCRSLGNEELLLCQKKSWKTWVHRWESNTSLHKPERESDMLSGECFHSLLCPSKPSYWWWVLSSDSFANVRQENLCWEALRLPFLFFLFFYGLPWTEKFSYPQITIKIHNHKYGPPGAFLFCSHLCRERLHNHVLPNMYRNVLLFSRRARCHYFLRPNRMVQHHFIKGLGDFIPCVSHR